MKRLFTIISLIILCCLQSSVLYAVEWEGVEPFDYYRIQSVQYPNAYLNTLTQAQHDSWTKPNSADWWVGSVLNPTNYFFLNSATEPTQFLYREGTIAKWIQIFADNPDRVSTNTSVWTSSKTNLSNGTYTIAQSYTDWFQTKYLYLCAQGDDMFVNLRYSDNGVNNACRWKSVKVKTSPRKFYIYNPAQGVFLKKAADGKTTITTDPEEASLIELNNSIVTPMPLKFSGTSNYVYHSKGTGAASTSALNFTFQPVTDGYYLVSNNGDKDRYMEASSTTILEFKKENFTDVNRTWIFITEEEYDQKVAASLLEDNKCYDVYLQAEDYVTPSSVSGAGSIPSSIQTSLTGDLYVKAHDRYVHFKSAGEIYLPISLPEQAKYSFTLWEVCATGSYLNIYSTSSTGTDASKSVSYGGKTYKRLTNGHLDFRGDGTKGQNAPFFTKTKSITLPAGDYLLGMEGAVDAGFDQILVEANEPVFCDKCYEYLICYNVDAISGSVLEETNILFANCDAADHSVTVPAGPAAPQGYSFGGWNTRDDMRGMIFNAGDNVTLPSVHSDQFKQMKLYTIWNPVTYTITLDKNGGTANGSAEIEYGAAKCTAINGVTYTGTNVLKGYYTAATGGEKVMSADGTLVAGIIGYTDRMARWTRGSDCTLYAQYGPLYTVTYSTSKAGRLTVIDDMGNKLASGAQVVDGTVLTFQARVSYADSTVLQWQVTRAGVDDPVITTTSGLFHVTVTSNTNVSVYYDERSTQLCYNAITIQCEDAPIKLSSDSERKGEALASPSTMKIGQSTTYVTGWTGSGYVDYDEAGSGSFMVYHKVNIPENGNYQIIVYGCNGGTKDLKIYQETSSAYSGLTNAVQYGGKTYNQVSTHSLASAGIGQSEWKTVMKQYKIDSKTFTAGNYIFGLSGEKQSKFDRIEIKYITNDKVFCFDKTKTVVNTIPWQQGSGLDFGDTVYVTPLALSGCITRAKVQVLGFEGDLFKVISVRAPGDTLLLMNNVSPGEIVLDLDKNNLRDNGFMIIGITSINLGDDNIIYGDTKSHEGIFVDGNTMYDANGVPFVMRGTNVAHVWHTGRTMTDLEAIARYGANTVRFVLGDGIDAAAVNHKQWYTPASEVAQIINKCEELGLVCVLEVHNATGDDNTSALSEAANYWKKIKNVLIGHEKTVVINIANEWMNSSDNTAWANAYKVEVAKLRAAGLHHCIMIDANGYGQGASSVSSDEAVEILTSDPDKNIVFSLHMYQNVAGSDNAVRNNINNALGKGLCLVVGEYGWAHKAVANVEVKYQTIISHTNEKNVGALSWSWYGNSGGVEYLDMVDADNNFIPQTANNTLIADLGPCDWGQYIVDNSWNWAGKMTNSAYDTHQVLQVRSITGEMDVQDYVIWEGKTPLAIGAGAKQLVVGPEHFSTAEVGDNLLVTVRDAGASPTGALLKTDAATAIQSGTIDISEGSYSRLLTAADLTELKEHGLVIRGQNYSIERVELEAGTCHRMRVKPDTLRVTRALQPLEEYNTRFEFGDWDSVLVFTKEALANIQLGDVLRVRITPSAGFESADARVSYRSANEHVTIGGKDSYLSIGYECNPVDLTDADYATTADFGTLRIDKLGGYQPDAAGYVDMHVDATLLNRLQTEGLIIFGKNAKLRSLMFIRDLFIIPADSAALVPHCGVDNLIIYQGGQAINKDVVTVYKKITYIRETNGEYSYCTFNDADASNMKGAGGTYNNEMNHWYTFTVPFAVNDVKVKAANKDAEYSIHAIYGSDEENLNSGSYHMKWLNDDNPSGVNEVFRARWQYMDDATLGYPQALVPYIIRFSKNEDGFNDYYERNHTIKFIYTVPAAASPLKISGRQTQFKVPTNGVSEYYYFHNNSLYDIRIDGSAYVLSDDGSQFELEYNPTIHPFECYVQATNAFKTRHAVIRMGTTAPEVDQDTPTSIEDLLAEAIMLDDPNTRAFDVMGREYDPQNLPHGVFILVNNDKAIKILR